MTRNHLPDIGERFWVGVFNAIAIVVVAVIVVGSIVALI